MPIFSGRIVLIASYDVPDRTETREYKYLFSLANCSVMAPRGRRRRGRKSNVGVAATQTSVIFQVVNGNFGTSGGTASYSSDSVVIDKTLTTRPASMSVDVGSPAPVVMFITASVEGIERYHSRDFMAGPTPRRITVHCPRNVDYGSKCQWNLTSSGTAIAAGSVSFTYKNPLSTTVSQRVGFPDDDSPSSSFTSL